MIKKTIYKFLPACLLAISFASCEDEATMPLPETVPLIVETSGKSFVMGETLTLTVKVNDEKNPDLTSNEDFDIYLTVKDGGTDVSEKLFKEFPSMVTFPKGERYIQIKLPIVDTGIEAKEKVAATITTFVRGYTVTNSAPSIVVSDQHYIVLSIKNNSDKIVKEGSKFTIRAELPIPVPYDMDINISVPADQEKFYTTLPPATLTIKAGEVSGEVTAETLRNKETKENANLVLNFTTASDIYPLDEPKMDIVLKDMDVDKGDKLLDERWVYEEPDVPFASAGVLSAVENEYGQAVEMKSMIPHPNAELAAKGWKFYNAWEFHSVGKSGAQWTMSAYGNRVPAHLPARNTAIVQNHAAAANDKFSNITDEGYLKMIQMKVPTEATGPVAGQMREYGTAAFYSLQMSGNGATYKSNSQYLLEGCRLEVRARLRGEKNGFNMAIWLMSSDAATQTTYSEVDILENPDGPASGNRAHQTFHYGNAATDKDSKTANKTIPLGEWNIYWMEWRSGEEIALGINGEETVCLKKSECSADKPWTFTNAMNEAGLRFILTMGAPSKWALGSTTGTETGGVWSPDPGWDAGFAKYNNYERDRDNDAIPRMEIDWVRTYINTPDVETYEGGRAKHTNTLFY